MAALPQLDPAEDACGVVDKAHVRTKVDIDAPAVTSTHIALVEKGERSEHSDGFAYPSVPPLVADLLPRSVTDLFVVGLVLSERGVREL